MSHTYTVDYIRGRNDKWVGRLRADATPDTTIDTREHDDFVTCAGEVYELAGPDAEVMIGDVRCAP